MANNRGALRCRVCKEVKHIMKYYPSTAWFSYPRYEQDTDEWNNWLQHHTWHDVVQLGDGTLEDGSPLFEFITENEECQSN